jgi:hypothetical protein
VSVSFLALELVPVALEFSPKPTLVCPEVEHVGPAHFPVLVLTPLE